MSAFVSGAAPATTAPTRPAGKPLAITPGGAGAESGQATPRSPRRESAKGLPSARTEATLPHGKGQQAASESGAAAATDEAGAMGDGQATALGLPGGEGVGRHASKPSATPSRRWGLIRKGVIPNPAIMKVNEKVVQIIQTLRKPPEDRSESDIKLLYTWLMNQEKLSSLFTTMSEISAKKLCKEMEFLHLESGDVVVNQGEKGNTCFILVSGMVSVFVRAGDEQKKYQRVTRAAVDGSTSRALLEQGLITFGAKVATLTPGATFGELCLIEPDSKRSATVVVDAAAQAANFIVLTAASYLRMTRSQTIEGTITDHIAFLQHTLLFRKWTKMQLMHLVNSMKLVTVPAGQHLVHKGSEADSFFVLLRGEAQECVRLLLHEHSDAGGGENRSVQHWITVQLTFLGKFDVAGEYLAAEKKVVTCPVDIRAVTDVDCLVLTATQRKLFALHFGGKELKKHAATALTRLRAIAQQRETWRETRVDQALRYPNLRVPITRKLMRLSGNCCLNCGRDSHAAGDELCMELATYRMDDEKKKKQSQTRETRAASKHRFSIVVPAQAQSHVQAAVARGSKAKAQRLPALSEDAEDEDDEDHSGSSSDEQRDTTLRLGHRLVRRQWKAAERAGLARLPQRPSTTPATVSSAPVQTRELRVTSITHAQHVSKRTLLLQRQGEAASVEDQVRRIRAAWTYGWRDLEPPDNQAPQPHFERLYRNSPRPTAPARMPRSAR